MFLCVVINAANRIEEKEEGKDDWSGLERGKGREYLVKYYTCARPECRYRRERVARGSKEA